MSSCLCPDVGAGRETIPSEPLKCGCCGAPLTLTCAGECGPKHVRAAFKVPKQERAERDYKRQWLIDRATPKATS